MVESKKTVKLPTPASMKEFAGRFTLEQWAQLCESPTFRNLVPENLIAAELCSMKILAGTWKEP